MSVHLALAALILTSCATSREFAAPAGEWQSWHGQLRYSGRDRPVIGEVVVRRAAPDHFQLEFLSGPGFPLLKLRTDGTVAVAEGVFARGRWRGAAAKAPDYLRGWLELPTAFGRQGEDGNRESLDIRVPETGERFQFQFGA